MDLSSFYRERVQDFTRKESAYERKNNRFTWLRLLLVISMIALGIYFYSISFWLSIVTVGVLFITFLISLKLHLSGIEQQKEMERFKIINQQELNSLDGDYSYYPSGEQYTDIKHYYTSDLDIFGTYSIFRYINRTTSPSGSHMLADWLKAPASINEIRDRQAAVKELSEMIDRRQGMQSIGLKYKDVSKELPGFLQWLESEPVLSGNRKLLTLMYVLPWITIAIIAATIMGWVPSVFIWLMVCIHLMMTAMVARKVNYLHQQVSRKVAFISTYYELISLFTGTDFTAPYLVALKKRFTDSGALKQIRTLQNRIKRLDYRLNAMFVPINVLFFFDYKHLVWLEKWRAESGGKLIGWFDAIARVEALSSFANIRFNHPSWAIPEIREDYFIIQAKRIGHPLIMEKERVCNDFSLDGEGKIAVVTGSNMSGKSTFQRSIGVNMVLALAGAPVCADSLVITDCQLYTYMRIADNLEERTSSFYAELKRLKQLIDITREGGQRIFFLLDEVLRGTNSRDRQIGSMALVRQLARQNVSGIIATHDLTLGDLETEMPDRISNAHFDVQINGEDMSFDYQLHPGICTSLNASILMKKIGINI
ncbi:MAG: hypothetical protein LBQ60_10595 [Bacteroidales bacterium]|jgi:predicted ATPase|nr:hypothetical protein [Bacteroidales bacterium]